MSRRMLITGGVGFIGSDFVRYWAHRHPVDKIVVVDSLTYTGDVDSIASVLRNNIEFVRG